MKKVIILSLIIVSILFLNCTNTSFKDTNKTDEDAPRLVLDRQYVSLQTTKKVPINFRSSLMLIDSVGQLLLFDKYAQALKQYDHSLNLIAKFGKKGPGPKEFRDVIAVKTDDQGGVHFCDRGQNAIKVFVADSLVKFAKVPLQIERAIFLEDKSKVIVQHTEKGFKLGFTIVDYSGDSVLMHSDLVFNEIFATEDGTALSHDGFFTKNECGEIYYTPYLLNEMYKLNARGHLNTTGSYVYEVPLPEVLIESNRAFPTSSFIHVINTFANCDQLCILNIVGNEDGERVLDCYNARSLAYETSYAIPYADDSKTDFPQSVAFHDDVFYVIYENQIIAYEEAKQ